MRSAARTAGIGSEFEPPLLTSNITKAPSRKIRNGAFFALTHQNVRDLFVAVVVAAIALVLVFAIVPVIAMLFTAVPPAAMFPLALFRCKTMVVMRAKGVE